MIVFDGRVEAKKREQGLAARVSSSGLKPCMVSVVFVEDAGSLLYTGLKKKAAERVGIEFVEYEVSIASKLEGIVDLIGELSGDGSVDGVMIQKPTKLTWQEATGEQDGFDVWWKSLVGAVDPKKDVDCLTEVNLDKVYDGTWKVLPATVKAVLSVLEIALGGLELSGKTASVIGRSDIVGRPLAAVLEQRGAEVCLFGSDVDSAVTREADVLISATGKTDLVGREMVKDGAVVIDVGAPKGDVKFDEVRGKAAFITPVPGGVGPMTVVSLLENLVDAFLVKA